MTRALMSDAFAHHVWATERLIDACAELSPEQLTTPVPGTYGSILQTFRHLVEGDTLYLSQIRAGKASAPIDEEAGLGELRSMM